MTGGHRPRRRFGQHFLVDEQVLDAMVAAIAPTPGQSLLEIGPGHGVLTERLLSRTDTLTAIEIDRDLAATLQERYPHLSLIGADVLGIDLNALLGSAGDAPWRVVGNLPYNISTPLLGRLLAHADRIADMHFLLQREVVDRLDANPGTKRWGRLSVFAQYHCAIEPLFDVPPGAFRPPPRVDSTFVRMTPRPPPQRALNADVFAAVIRAGFQQRRKTLRNALKAFAIDWQSAPVAPNLRPDQLNVAGYVQLANQVAEQAAGTDCDPAHGPCQKGG